MALADATQNVTRTNTKHNDRCASITQQSEIHAFEIFKNDSRYKYYDLFLIKYVQLAGRSINRPAVNW